MPRIGTLLLFAGAAALAAGAGCGSPSNRTITGRLSTTFVHVDGSLEADKPYDLTGRAVAALVANKSGYTSYPGTAQSTGEFTIPNVPQGQILLRIGDSYYETDAKETISATTFEFGRSDRVTRGADSANVALQLTNMRPWVQSDFLQIDCPSIDNFWFNTSDADPMDGDTTVNGRTYQGSAQAFGDPAIIEAAKDHCQVEHTTTPDPTAAINGMVISEMAPLMPFTTVAGQTTTATGTFTALPLDQSATITFNGQTILNAFPGQKASDFSGLLEVSVQPVSGTKGVMANVVTPLIVTFPIMDGQQYAATWGEPFPGWSEVITVNMQRVVQPKLPGTTRPGFVFSGYLAQYADRTVLAKPIGPDLGPPQSVTIDGMPLDQATSTSLTPLVAWKAPAIGTPTFYTVNFIALSVDPTDSTRTKTDYGSAIVTRQTSIHVPDGMLSAGGHYVVQVQAVVAPVTDLTEDLASLPVPWITADVLSGILGT